MQSLQEKSLTPQKAHQMIGKNCKTDRRRALGLGGQDRRCTVWVLGYQLDVLPGPALNSVLAAGALAVMHQAELARALHHTVESVVLAPTEAQKQNLQGKSHIHSA